MSRPGSRSVQAASGSRWKIVAAALGVFVLLDLGLFGWLIFRTLSQREIERVLFETRQEAENLATRIEDATAAGDGDLLQAVARERETRTYIDSILRRRDVVQTLEVRDRSGQVVFRGVSEATLPVGGVEAPPSRELEPQVERRSVESQSTYDLDVPIGELGILHIGINRGELEKRIAVLRHDLVLRTSVLAGLTALVMVVAYLLLNRLWRRGRALEEQARESERLAYVGTLAAGLAHEIRNPLNSLRLNMQLLEEDLPSPAESAGAADTGRLVSMARREIGRLERLVTDFLTYARPRNLELQSMPAARLLARCRELIGAEALARGVRLEVTEPVEADEVAVDEEQFTQLLLNLVRNSLAAEAGRVALSARRRGADRVVISVTDDGHGVEAEDLPRIFDLFYSKAPDGTGLGLAVVRRIAHDHGAEIEVDSEPGEGTTVRVTLARASRASGAERRNATGSARPEALAEPTGS